MGVWSTFSLRSFSFKITSRTTLADFTSLSQFIWSEDGKYPKFSGFLTAFLNSRSADCRLVPLSKCISLMTPNISFERLWNFPGEWLWHWCTWIAPHISYTGSIEPILLIANTLVKLSDNWLITWDWGRNAEFIQEKG